MSVRIVSALERQHRGLAQELRDLFAVAAKSRDVTSTLRDIDPDLTRLRTSIDAVETTLRTFLPEWSASDNYVRPRTKRSPFEKGQLRGHFMAILRESNRAWTANELFDEIIARHLGKRPIGRDNSNLKVGLRAQLKRDYDRGLLERTDDPERWRLIRKSERAAPKQAPASTAASAV